MAPSRRWARLIRLIAWTFEHGHRAVCSGVLIGSFLDVLEVGAGSTGGVGQLGMAHPSDGPASSLRMFGHVHRAMCSD